MANASILAAFERMWHHITSALSNKSDTDHNHDEVYASINEATTQVEDDGEGNVILTNVAVEEGAIVQETDPTVPAWAKQPTKPSYTPDEVGAAPAGFGLGTTFVPTMKDFNVAVPTGWYYADETTANKPSGVGYATIQNINLGGTATQIVYEMTNGYIVKRSHINGEWEWVNPPMQLGVEYRTTERFNGKPVYVVAMDLGTLPTSGDKDVYYPVSLNCENIVSYDVIISNPSYGARSLPTFTSDGSVMAYAWSLNAVIRITVLRDMSGYNGRAIIKYTKD